MVAPPKTFLIKLIKRFIFWQSSYVSIVSYADLSLFSNGVCVSKHKTVEIGQNRQLNKGVINFPDEHLTELERKVNFTSISNSAGTADSSMKRDICILKLSQKTKP